MTLIADFLTGSLLSLLLPVALLCALVAWYLLFIKGVPETVAGKDGASPTTAGQATDVPVADQGPSVAVSDDVNRRYMAQQRQADLDALCCGAMLTTTPTN